MKSFSLLLLLLSSLLLFSGGVRAEDNCPEGYYPIGGGSPGAPQGCAPIPGYDQGQKQPQQQTHSGPIWVDSWGAIATDAGHGSVGVANNVASPGKAEEVALNDCRSRGGANCKVDTRFRNACGALIAGDTGFNAGSAPTLDQAIQTGMKVCTDAGTPNCHVYYSACSSAKRIF